MTEAQERAHEKRSKRFWLTYLAAAIVRRRKGDEEKAVKVARVTARLINAGVIGVFLVLAAAIASLAWIAEADFFRRIDSLMVGGLMPADAGKAPVRTQHPSAGPISEGRRHAE